MQVGFKALADRYRIALAQPLRVESVIGTTRMSHESNGHVERKYPSATNPRTTLQGISSSGSSTKKFTSNSSLAYLLRPALTPSKPGAGKRPLVNMPAGPDSCTSG